MFCPEDRPRFNPLTYCECIPEAHYQLVFDHDLGPDCLGDEGGISDDSDRALTALTTDDLVLQLLPPPGLDFDHVSDPSECGDGTYFSQEACACFTPVRCYIECSDFFTDLIYLNPIDGATCISEDQYLSIFDHNLGPDCLGDDTESIEIIRYDSQDDCNALDSNPLDLFQEYTFD